MRRLTKIAIPVASVAVGLQALAFFGPDYFTQTHSKQAIEQTTEPYQKMTESEKAQCNAELLEGIATKDFTPFGAVTGENYKLPSESPSDMTSYYNLHAKLNPQDNSGIITPGNVYRALDLNGDGKIKGLIPFNKDRRLDDIAEELTSSGLIKRQNPFQLYSGRCDTSKTYKAGDQ